MVDRLNLGVTERLLFLIRSPEPFKPRVSALSSVRSWISAKQAPILMIKRHQGRYMTIMSMLFKGTLGDDHVYQCDFDGSGWSAPAIIAEIVTGTHPIWVRYYDQTLFASWHAAAPSHSIQTARYDGPNFWTWWGENPPGAVSSVAPAAAHSPWDDAKMFLFWKADTDTSIRSAVFDSLHWSASLTVAGASTSHSPAAVGFNNQLHLVWKGAPGDYQLYRAYFDGAMWSAPQAIFGAFTSSQPAVAVYNGQLAIAWRGALDDPGLYWLSLYPNGSSFDPIARIRDLSSETGPALLNFNGRLHLVYRGAGNDSALYMANWDGTAWWPSHPIPGAASTSSPTIAEFDPWY
jgi:hypothetical protein